MRDARRQELERCWRSTGDPDVEAALLLERLRLGELSQERLEAAACARYPAACAALGRALEPLRLQVWTSRLEALLPRALPFARLAVCWSTADAWREEAGGSDLDPLVFAIQDEVYQPSPRHRRALIRLAAQISRPAGTGPNGMRARRAQGMVGIVKNTAASLGEGKLTRPFGSAFPRGWSFSAFVAAALWVFESRALVARVADALGERILYEGGDWGPLASEDPERFASPG